MGGTIRAVHNAARYLAATHEVEILSLVRMRDDAFFGDPPGVKITALDDMRPDAVPRPLRRLRDLLSSKETLLLDSQDRPAESASLWMDLQLVRRLRGRTGFLIGTRPGLNLPLAELAPPGVTLVGEEQLHLAAHSPELQESIRTGYPKLDALVVLTEADRHAYDELLGGAVPITVIPNTAHESKGAPADLSAPRVLSAGRLVEQKGFDLLIDAWVAVAPEHTDWTLRICGKGPLKKELRRQVRRLELGDTVELPGARVVADEMTEASIFVLSSRFEGFPLVLLEAMSQGMAVVAFDCPTGPGEIVRAGENGILVAAGDVLGLAAGMRTLIEDDALRRRLGAAAVETAKRFSVSSVGPRWVAFLDELHAAHGGHQDPEAAKPAR